MIYSENAENRTETGSDNRWTSNVERRNTEPRLGVSFTGTVQKMHQALGTAPGRPKTA